MPIIIITVYLTHLDYTDTENIMTEKLHNQVNGTEWSWKNLNTVSTKPLGSSWPKILPVNCPFF